MDLNTEQKIVKLQQLEQKLKRTVEAQKALQNNIPYYLEKNLNCLKENFPKLYSKFKNYNLKDNFKLTCNHNGEPNVVYPDGHMLYSETPFSDCLNQVNEFINKFYDYTRITNTVDEKNSFNQLHFHYKNRLYSKVSDLANTLKKQDLFKKNSKTQNPDSVPLMCMFGLGLGFQLGYLYEKFTPVNLYIIEPNSDFFYLSLCTFDYTPLIEYIKSRQLGLKFFIDDDVQHFFDDFNFYNIKYETNLSAISFFYHYESESTTNLWSKLERDISSIHPKRGFFDVLFSDMCISRRNIIINDYYLTKKK